MNADPEGNVGGNPEDETGRPTAKPSPTDSPTAQTMTQAAAGAKAAADQPPALRRGTVIKGVLSEPSAARDRLLELL